jgi:hypothetical protein
LLLTGARWRSEPIAVELAAYQQRGAAAEQNVLADGLAGPAEAAPLRQDRDDIVA